VVTSGPDDFGDARFQRLCASVQLRRSCRQTSGVRARSGNSHRHLEAILDETIGVLLEKFKRDPSTLNDIRQKLTATCNFIASTGTLDVVKEDPDDNRILECAEAAHSDYVVSEDKDLLRLGLYGEIRIVDIDSFLAITARADDAH
jgi:hypothetical protein